MTVKHLQRALAAIFAGALVLVPPAAAKDPPRCITREQLGTLTHVILPIVVAGALDRCGTLLPPDAYLVRSAAKLRADFPSATLSDPSAARIALEAFAGKPLPTIDDAALSELFTTTMTKELGLGRLTAPQCRDASEILEPLGVLSPAQFERVIVAIFAVVGRGRESPRMCTSEASSSVR